MEHSPAFYRLGKFIYKKHKTILFIWFALLVGCLPFLKDLMTPFKTMGFEVKSSKSAKATQFLAKHLGYGDARIVVAYSSKTLTTDDPLYAQQIHDSLSHLKAFTVPHEIIYPSNHNKQFSKNKAHALAIIAFKTSAPLTDEDLNKIKTSIKKPSSLDIQLGGDPIFIEDVDKQTQMDLLKADVIAAPISILIMILVFGSLIAASIPIVLGGVCAVVVLATLYFFAKILTLSVFTINISLLLGLCLSLDYSLFFMSRFKEELHKNLPMDVVIGTTMTSAGRAIFYSGIAVFISLSALLVFPIPILFSIGMGGLTAVFFAVAVALILLPAVLSVVQEKVNYLPVRLVSQTKNHYWWRWLAKKVVRSPFFFFLPSFTFLLFLSLPFLNAKLGISDVNILPENSESRKFLDVYKKNFNEHSLNPIQLIASTSNQDILSTASLSDLKDLTTKLKSNPAVDEVTSIIPEDKKITNSQLHQLYHLDKQYQDPAITQLLNLTTGKHFTLIHLIGKYPLHSSQTKQLVQDMRQLKHYKGLSIQVTGIPVNNLEVIQKIAQLFPYAFIWVVVLTYLILLILLHSLLLPLKAIVMNILSLSASYGVLVYVFQKGYLHQILHFDPQGMLDLSLLIIIFCALFGFSMDYEVFLLTRMKECYEKTKNTKQSIVSGIEQSGRIITSAAIIVVVLCGSFMTAKVLMVKEFGLGIAIAIFVDAFVVRTLLVPSVMVFLGKWNWYLPRWINNLLPKAYHVYKPAENKSLKSKSVSQTKNR